MTQPEPEKIRPANGESVGENIAAEMLKHLVRLNDNIEKSHAMYAAIAESLATLTDYHETWMRATEILVEKSDGGKNKFSIGDFVHAVAEAAEEVMGDAEEEEDEPGPEDPLVGRHR